MVSSDVDVCSQIGVDVMKKGGNAVDAAIGMTPWFQPWFVEHF